MRIQRICLEWFRGAAAEVALDVKGKSAAVYGPNGSGKSSFVDAVEYFLCEGRIGHLTHEYSGKKQEKGVINTHKPTLDPARARIEFTDGSSAQVIVSANGAFTTKGDGLKHVETLDYRRVVLRQDEVARFVSSAKAEKYSALLPLLGLEQLETSAENVRQLSKRLEKRTDLDGKRGEERAKRALARGYSSQVAETTIAEIHHKHLGSTPRAADLAGDCAALDQALRSSLEQVSPDAARHAALRGVAKAISESVFNAFTTREADLADTATKLLSERVDVLERAKAICANQKEASGQCPVCGQVIARSVLVAHIEAELTRYAQERTVLSSYRDAENDLVRAVSGFQQSVLSTTVKDWWVGRIGESARRELEWLEQLQPESLRGPSGRTVRDRVKALAMPLVAQATADTATAPPGTRDLVEDHQAVQGVSALLAAEALSEEVKTLERISSYLDALEHAIRNEIRRVSDEVIADISADIQRMWGILHPGNDIENVRLSHPDGADKAIDIELKFFGVEQKSPRLTLSEGNRNSLGLCVFLSIAKKADSGVPVVLDDVVVSLDREHRGMLVELLHSEFADRQVLLFTHDRDWFAELRSMLGAGWSTNHILRPYTDPSVGINWSDKTAAWDDARSHLETAPHIAANTARKIMDVELAVLADRLRLTMEYRRGFGNDHRVAHDFLKAMMGVCDKAFLKRVKKGDTDEYVAEPAVKVALAAADSLLITWGNKGSHDFDVVKAEAKKLIETCEGGLAMFTCSACKKPIYRLDDGSKFKQCECGGIRWRYDRA